MKKVISSVAALLMALLMLAGCSSQGGESSSAGSSAPGTGSSAPASSAEKTKVNVFAIKGPTGVGMVNLMKADEEGSVGNDYSFQIVSAPDEISGKLSSGEADIAALPTNMAATLYGKTEGKLLKMLAVNTLGVLYIMENGDSIQSAADLRGKTIYTTGQGAKPEYVLKYVLEKNGIDPETDVKIEYVSQNEELAALLANGTAQVAMVPEPTVTTILAQKPELRVALNVTEEWDKASGGASKLMMGCVVVRSAFAAEHPEAVETFLAEYKASVEKAAAELENTAALCESYGIIPKAAVAKQAIPRCNLVYIDGAEMKAQISGYFDVLYAANPKSVGGAVPDEAFYYGA